MVATGLVTRGSAAGPAVRGTALALLSLLALSPGCGDPQRHEYTINPNGSGKVFYQVENKYLLPLALEPKLIRGRAADVVPGAVTTFLKKSRGVVAWKDVSVKSTAASFGIRGTAYFDDVSKVRLYLQRPFSLRVARGEEGKWLLESVNESLHKMKAPRAEPEEEVPLEQVSQFWKGELERAKQPAGFDVTLVDLTVNLPGPLGQAVIFKPIEGKNAVSIAYRRHEFERARAEVNADIEFLRARQKSGLSGYPIEEINEKLFGVKAMPSATVTGELKPLFDYKAEVAAAKEAFPQVLKNFGIDPKDLEAKTEAAGD